MQVRLSPSETTMQTVSFMNLWVWIQAGWTIRTTGGLIACSLGIRLGRDIFQHNLAL